jgi:hypothetical protein
MPEQTERCNECDALSILTHLRRKYVLFIAGRRTFMFWSRFQQRQRRTEKLYNSAAEGVGITDRSLQDYAKSNNEVLYWQRNLFRRKKQEL